MERISRQTRITVNMDVTFDTRENEPVEAFPHFLVDQIIYKFVNDDRNVEVVIGDHYEELES